MRIVITGASGNVGTALLRALAETAHDVVGLARRRPGTDQAPYDGVTWREVDLTSDVDVRPLRTAVHGADAVVHLAWGFQPSHREDQLEALGVGGTQRVVDAVASEGVGHLVHMSSVGAYSPRLSEVPVSEDYPTEGVPGSPYSRHKATAERLLDAFEVQRPDVTVARLRPGIVGQASAGSAMLRYAVPGVVPAGLLGWLPLLPLDRRLVIPVVHSDDVATAVVRVLETRAGGAFNLAADPPVTVTDVARALHARSVHVPARLLRATVSAAWHARLLQLDPGWVDLAYAVPLLNTTRARIELGWVPKHTGPEVVEAVVAGLTNAASDSTPVLRPRSVVDNLRRFASRGPVDTRSEP